MALIINFQTLKERIMVSNNKASTNRNKYPIQEQATLKEIWKYIPCECNSSCTCKKFNCNHHWKLKESLLFHDILIAYMRMFVDKPLHKRILGWVNRTLQIPDKVHSRAQGALLVLTEMRDNWEQLYSNILDHDKTLICDEWFNYFLKNQWNFPLLRTSVHRAKQFCILLPDIGIPYDFRSRIKVLKFFKKSAITYFEMLNKLRDNIISLLNSENQTLSNFRRLDCTQEYLPFDSNSILFKRKDFNYGNSYTPDERPLSRIIDKFLYQPSI